MWCSLPVLKRSATVTACALIIAAGAKSQAASSHTAEAPLPNPGQVSLELPDLPPATVEIDLGRGMIQHSLSLGDAAIAGILEGLSTSSDSRTDESAKFIAQQLTSARELSDAISQVVHEVHVRVWNDLPKESQIADKAVRHFDATLKEQGWESTLRAREDGKLVRVLVHREGDRLTGVLLIASERDELVVANVIGDLSPENVHRVTKTATTIAMKLGLDKELNKAVEKLKREMAR